MLHQGALHTDEFLTDRALVEVRDFIELRRGQLLGVKHRDLGQKIGSEIEEEIRRELKGRGITF